ncbi:c-type cytochrome [Desulfotalea psychrophila]|uniref:Cytochrome c domain-containing protein n=1 Tax=Desulfotalea psychrophila (strain LSv54 / DSM 12343) TaxID=177439 RepID=Q6AQY8_DESPS|nr:c-type cytochrome [Desulfotalea psychrophila]CAG35236.1 unknown protein [Desulfotalea psychrophila LSv54]
MHPLIASVLALLFVLVAGITLFLMLEITGRIRDNGGKSGLISAHRILGYLFIALFALILFFMIEKAAGLQQELSARAVFHIALALALIPLLLVKVLVVRRLPHCSEKLPLLGITIFTFSFVLSGITAGYYILHRSDFVYTTLSVQDSDVLDIELGKALMTGKCNKCHSLERVYRAYKSEDDWVVTVNRMAQLDSPNITGFDLKQVLNYLLKQQEERQGRRQVDPENEMGRSLVSRKCTLCHNLDRVFEAKKSAKEWTVTVERMIVIMDEPDFLDEEEQADIISFLSERENVE